jgi:hypothetical protein
VAKNGGGAGGVYAITKHIVFRDEVPMYFKLNPGPSWAKIEVCETKP